MSIAISDYVLFICDDAVCFICKSLNVVRKAFEKKCICNVTNTTTTNKCTYNMCNMDIVITHIY